MTHGHLAAVVAPIMRRGFVPVPVGGETDVLGQFGNAGQPVADDGIDPGDDLQMDFAGQIAPPRASEGAKLIVIAGRVLESKAVFLQEAESAWAGFEHQLHSHVEPDIVGKLRARP
jgi:hypothetical protein